MSSAPPKVDPTVIPNVVQYDQFAREWQQILNQDNFDGFRIEAGKTVTKNMQANHSLFLGTSLSPNQYLYQFGPTYATDDGRTVMVGRLGMDGGVNARLMKKLFKGTDLKINANSNLHDPQRNMYEFTVDQQGEDWAASAKLAYQGTWISNVSFAQEVTNNLSLGGELTHVAVNGVSIGGLGARYVWGPNYLSFALGRQPDFKQGPQANVHSAKMQYVRKVSDRLAIGSEFEYSQPEQESQLRLGYEYTFRHARVQGLLDTCGKVSCFVQDFMGFGISGMVDFVKGDYRFGFMMHMVPQPEDAAAAGGAPTSA
ncbi:conserved hypothetical protein [Perkinsus marinus ATCC 50983]|uniref:Mitochondrial import receptor subunit tom40 n=3 Tax=Perkinsus marinus (strain ATCC 50983 / TXsc) TaxID=423536 RepID=C5KB35_PERM5|nr:conserved hypothetical protein [Perkinsus marinus ATCC 50983]EER18361.1 conserved hypothetical protein [Perkinsus marinus ATCC 50983]|eukprot:XP_002786565.1 conserved hypothetical protein [Perkinsus marinus ATCC 50983]